MVFYIFKSSTNKLLFIDLNTSSNFRSALGYGERNVWVLPLVFYFRSIPFSPQLLGNAKNLHQCAKVIGVHKIARIKSLIYWQCFASRMDYHQCADICMESISQ